MYLDALQKSGKFSRNGNTAFSSLLTLTVGLLGLGAGTPPPPWVGLFVGDSDGCSLGTSDGVSLGASDGDTLGDTLGLTLGVADGIAEGEGVGASVGVALGILLTEGV